MIIVHSSIWRGRPEHKLYVEGNFVVSSVFLGGVLREAMLCAKVTKSTWYRIRDKGLPGLVPNLDPRRGAH